MEGKISMNRKWIKQDEKAHCCGQIAVAVIANITLEESIKLIGKKGGTSTKELVKALKKLGYKCPYNKCKRMPVKPKLGLGQLHRLGYSGWHWIAIDGDKIYDGLKGNPDGTVNWNSDWRITSYLPVYEKKNK